LPRSSSMPQEMAVRLNLYATPVPDNKSWVRWCESFISLVTQEKGNSQEIWQQWIRNASKEYLVQQYHRIQNRDNRDLMRLACVSHVIQWIYQTSEGPVVAVIVTSPTAVLSIPPSQTGWGWQGTYRQLNEDGSTLWDLRFSRRWLWRMVSSAMLRRVTLVKTDVSEEPGASFIRVTRIGELGTTQAATSSRRTLRRNSSVARFSLCCS
jgi:hypothetical protein